MPDGTGMAKATGIVSTAALASRLLGLARDVLLAAMLGAGPVADAFFVAWRLPNLFRRLLGEGGLNGALVPLERRVAAEQGAEAGARFAGQALTGTGLATAIVVAAIVAGAPGLVGAMAPGLTGDPETFALAVACLRLACPSIAGAALAGMAAALLNAQGRFAAPALAGLSTNLIMIAAILALGAAPLGESARAIGLAGAVNLGALIQFGLLIRPLNRLAPRPRWRLPRWSPELRGLVLSALPGLVVASVGQLAMLIAALVASADPAGISYLNYADRLFQLPLGFVAVGASIVLLPELARLLQGSEAALHPAQNEAIRLSLALSLPAAAALWLLAEPIVAVLFQRGAFGSAATAATAATLAALALGLPGAALARVMSLPFFAREKPRIPLAAALAGLLATGLGAILARPVWGVAGVAGAVSLGLGLNAALLLLVARLRGWWAPDPRLARAALGLLAATVGMAAALAALAALLAPWLAPNTGFAPRAGALALLGVNGLAVYALLAVLFGAVTRADLAGRG